MATKQSEDGALQADGPSGAVVDDDRPTRMDRERAVVLAYRSMSAALVDRLDVEGDTHWERLAAAERAGLDGDALAALERLTRTYERAAYAPGAVDPADSQWATELAAGLAWHLE